MKFKLSFIILIFTLSSCVKKEDYRDYEYIISDIPVNLVKFNSKFDDFRVTIGNQSFNDGMYFSSNRATNGAKYDIVHKFFDIVYSSSEHQLKLIYIEKEKNEYQLKLLSNINKNGSCEIGPLSYYENASTDYFFFSNNADGPFNMMYSYSDVNSNSFVGPFLLSSVNTSSNDYFPTINIDKTELLYSSLGADSYDILSLSLQKDEALKDYLPNSTSSDISRVSTLSSSSNDKAPFIKEDIIVFSSDRDGGFGGYDLYYSKYIDGSWTTPANFGSAINSVYDEYAPSIFDLETSDNIMIFSSNKLGGQGLYDLYVVDARSFF